MKKNFTLFPLCVLLSLSFAASAQNSALNLDGLGTDHYVSTQNDIIPTSGPATVELWAYVPSIAGGVHQFVYDGTSGSLPFSIGYDGGTGNIIVGEDATNPTPGTPFDTGIPMPAGQWVNIAVTYDNSGNVALYLNGVQKTTFSTFGFSTTGGGTFLQIGAQTTATQVMTGRIDELRIWNVIRTPRELRNGLFGVDPASPGLVAYYQMNDNTAGTTIANNSTSPDAFTGNATGTWVNGAAWVASPIQFGNNAINVNGATNDQVKMGVNSAYDFTAAGGTVEVMVYPTSLTTNNSMLVGTRGATFSNTGYSFHISSGNVSVWNSSSLAYFTYNPTDIPLNTWTALAFVYNGSNNTAVYANGNLIGNLGLLGTGPGGGFTEQLSAVTGQPLIIGSDENSAESFTGSIDEVRIWSSQLTPLQIQTNMGNGLTGTEPNLVGLWNFNEGNPGNNNQFLTTVPDRTYTANDGTLSASMTLTTAVSNFVVNSGITPLPVNFTSFTATAQDGQALLQWQTAQEQNSRDYSIERSADGVNYKSIGSVPAAGNSTLPSNYSFVDALPLNGTNYYRLKESDLDNKYLYSVVRSLNFSLGSGQKLVWFQSGGSAVEVNLLQGSNELYTITDISGRTIQQGQLSSGKLYLSQVPGGIYVVKVTTLTGTRLTTKVLVK